MRTGLGCKMVDNKIIFSDNGTLNDLTSDLSNYYSSAISLPIVAAQDYLYIGSYFPFNFLYFKTGTANDQATNLSVDVWANSQWVSTVEINDGTDSGGASFGQSGCSSWVPNRNNGWQRDDTVTPSGTEIITGLGSVTVYDRYWARLSWSADFNVASTMSWIGTLFSNDDDLGAEYPDLTRSAVLDAWESGKTTWEEQHVKAAEIIIQDLRNKRIIVHKSQILERNDFKNAAVSKVAEIIFSGLGPDYDAERIKAKTEYEKRISSNSANIDKNANGNLDRVELMQVIGSLGR